MFPGETLSNTTTLTELGVAPDTVVTLLVHLTGSPAPQPHPPVPKASSDTFTTSIMVGRDTKEVLVKIRRSEFKKPFLGGYRHQESGLEYHNAAVQTLPRPRPPREVSS